MRLHNKLSVLRLLNQHLIAYPTPSNLNWAWNFGSLAGLLLATQMLTGILLAMHYVPHVDMAFSSVIHLMSDVPSGTAIRYAHANGASAFFAVAYLHVLRGIYYSSGNQPRELVWLTGVVILLLMVITAFIGYVLPWGQMSFWGATVITSLATTLPVVGKGILYWLWGGFSVDNPTLNRFYSLHYTLPFVLAALSLLHISALHQYGSTNPLGVHTAGSTIPFGPYYASKDLLGVLVLFFVYAILICFYPEYLGHPDNLLPANPYATPHHIQPEWYFLWFYAVLRSIPSKALGVVAIGLVFACLIALPFMSMPSLGSPRFRLLSERAYWGLVAIVGLLTYLGACEITPLTTLAGQICSFILFAYLVVVLPLLGWFESQLYLGAATKLPANQS